MRACLTSNFTPNTHARAHALVRTQTPNTSPTAPTPAALAAQKALEREAEREAFRQAVETPCSQQSYAMLRQMLDIISGWKEEYEGLELELEGDSASEAEDEEGQEPRDGSGTASVKIDVQVLVANLVFAAVYKVCCDVALSWVTSEDIDQFLCTAVEWLAVPPDTGVATHLLTATAETLAVLERKFSGAQQAKREGIPMSDALAKSSQEWTEFFRPAAGDRILPLFLSIARPGAEQPATLVNAVCKATRLVSAAKAAAGVTFDDLLPLMCTGDAWPAFAAFHLLGKLVSPEGRGEGGDAAAAGLAVEGVDGEEGAFVVTDLAAARLKGLWQQIDAQMATVAQAAEPLSSPACYRLLLAWHLALTIISAEGVDKRPALAETMKETDRFGEMLLLLFRLLPDQTPSDVVSAALGAAFEPTPATFGVEMVVSLYYHAVAALPAVVRQWFDEQRSRQLVLKVEDFTAKHVSPRLVQLELDIARTYVNPPPPTEFDEDEARFVVRARGGAGEVAAIYTKEAMTMEMVVVPSPVHPLKNAEVSVSSDAATTRPERECPYSPVFQRWMEGGRLPGRAPPPAAYHNLLCLADPLRPTIGRRQGSIAQLDAADGHLHGQPERLHPRLTSAVATQR